ncbi:MAG: uroporphyrinogen-III C-methyltransferase [Terriglobia bacterium]
MTGKVYLVGAGPGDPGLFTLKGKAALERADCVIYDILANDRLLRFTRPDCERIFVGNLGPRPNVRQTEINRLMVLKAREGRVVVRLKGGDPFIFGRGGEEAMELVKAGMGFEVVPGISSGYAAPAYAGIPVTHREYVSGVTFITGHEVPEGGGASLDWATLAPSGNTLVFFMSSKNLGGIATALIKHGRKPETPVAIIRWGTKAEQQVTVGTLAGIMAKPPKIQPPSITVVGEVVNLREYLNWFERLPLFGKRIAITRARDQADALRDSLEELGAQTIVIPTIEIRDPASWEPLDRAIDRLNEFEYLLVTSANGVRNFLRRLDVCGRDVRDLKGLIIGAIGPATAAEFAKTGVKVDFIPKEYRAEGLLEVLGARKIKGKHFLIPRARVARDIVPRVLEERGARVEVVAAYETALPEFGKGELDRVLTPAPDVITFTSSSTATHFARLLGDQSIKKVMAGVAIASIGPITSATLRKLGLKITIEAQESTASGLVHAITEHFRSGTK